MPARPSRGLFECWRPRRTWAARHDREKIVLIDGQELAKLMIQYNLGVATKETFDVKHIDSDYFNEE